MTIYIPPTEIQKKTHLMISEKKAHYLINVMRCKVGDNLSVIDGAGKAYEAEIESIKNGKVSITILKEIFLDTESPFNLILAQSLIKGQKMDIVIQKATELGVKEIIPIITERVVIKETRKHKRWLKIAEETAEQCGRAVIPEIREPITIENLFEQINKDLLFSFKGLIFWERGGKKVKDALREVVEERKNRDNEFLRTPFYVIIGPEGGLSSNEVTLAEKNGFIKVTLGKRLLKSETASIVSIALIQFLLEDFSQS